MLVLSRKLREKIVFPDLNTTIQIVDVKSNTVRVGIEAPSDVRVLREEVPDRVAEWGQSPDEVDTTMSLMQLNRLLQKRLDIARHGLTELRRQLLVGDTEDLAATLESLDDDLQLLQRRVQSEVDLPEPELVTI